MRRHHELPRLQLEAEIVALCACGCGGVVPVNRRGRPGRYINGHQNKSRWPLPARFWARVTKSDACWEWTGQLNGGGYGAIKHSGRIVSDLAHRVSWTLHYGDIPKDMLVCHHCDNRRCVRPDHLFLGTSSDNARDMIAKGRHPRAKLTTHAARDIFQRARSGERNLTLALEFHVDSSMISNIVSRRRWRAATESL